MTHFPFRSFSVFSGGAAMIVEIQESRVLVIRYQLVNSSGLRCKNTRWEMVKLRGVGKIIKCLGQATKFLTGVGEEPRTLGAGGWGRPVQ